jgi:sirohydrochlorin cobaltochelatase
MATEYDRPQDRKPGVLLVGHGTRRPSGIAEFEQLAALVAQRLAPMPVASAFLEHAEPSIAAAVERMNRADIDRLAVVPVLLFAAGHAKRDIPAAVEPATHGTSIARTIFASPLGCDDTVIELSAGKYYEAIPQSSHIPHGDTQLILVGRGSSDAEATREMHRFAQLRRERTPVGALSVCFLAVAQPSFDEAIHRAAAGGCARVVVQPHLLFAGELVDRIRARVQAIAAANAEKSWIFAEPLGPMPDLADVIAQKALGALAFQSWQGT